MHRREDGGGWCGWLNIEKVVEVDGGAVKNKINE
jgi:hypothetical protein